MNNTPFILIYYNFKGFAQIIRYLLRYLELPYVEIFLDEYEQQKQTLSPQIKQALKAKVINKNELPAIIHNDQITYELNHIMNYICLISNREDLLGRTIHQKAHVCEFQEIYARKIRANMFYIAGFMGEIMMVGYEGVNLLQFLEKKLLHLLEESGYFMELSTYLMIQKEQKYILGDLTIMDFYFKEVCRFTLIMFGNIDEELALSAWIQKAKSYRMSNESAGKKTRSIEILRVMKKYQAFIQNEDFYSKNKAYYDSFSYFPKMKLLQVQKQQNILAQKKLEQLAFLQVFYGRE